MSQLPSLGPSWGGLIIKGYCDTSEGIRLDYEKKQIGETPKSRKKYSLENIEVVKSVYENYKKYSLVKQFMATNHDLNISLPTIKKMVVGGY